MKKSKMSLLVLPLLFILGFYGVAFSGDGFEDPACITIPDPTSGPFIWGNFTAAYDKSECSISVPEECAHYNIHIVLRRFAKMHLFSQSVSVPFKNICTFSGAELKEQYKRLPCKLGVGEAFNLAGTPVIAELLILKKDFCGDLNDVEPDAMISGEIVIRVVPLKQ